jgi:hypothetical protein
MKIKSFTIENTWFSVLRSHGWGNGYAIVPPGHPAHGKSCNEINVDVHGRLTLAVSTDQEWKYLPEGTPKNHWVVGFDTTHHGDTMKNWSKEAVEVETQRLVEQLEKMVNAPD